MKRNRLTTPKTLDTTGRLNAGMVITAPDIPELHGKVIGTVIARRGGTGEYNRHVTKAVDSDVVYLVACVRDKRVNTTPARDLYVSDWFKKARAYVEATGKPWFILSAQYGLVRPTELIKPYEKTLNTMSVKERKTWAANVWRQMQHHIIRPQRFVILAGERYRDDLLPYFEQADIDVLIPMQGLTIGRQLQWLKQALTTRKQAATTNNFFRK